MALGLDFWIQLLVVLAALFYGARKGGMGLGLIGGIGLSSSSSASASSRASPRST